MSLPTLHQSHWCSGYPFLPMGFKHQYVYIPQNYYHVPSWVLNAHDLYIVSFRSTDVQCCLSQWGRASKCPTGVQGDCGHWVPALGCHNPREPCHWRRACVSQLTRQQSNLVSCDQPARNIPDLNPSGW